MQIYESNSNVGRLLRISLHRTAAHTQQQALPLQCSGSYCIHRACLSPWMLALCSHEGFVLRQACLDSFLPIHFGSYQCSEATIIHFCFRLCGSSGFCSRIFRTRAPYYLLKGMVQSKKSHFSIQFHYMTVFFVQHKTHIYNAFIPNRACTHAAEIR